MGSVSMCCFSAMPHEVKSTVAHTLLQTHASQTYYVERVCMCRFSAMLHETIQTCKHIYNIDKQRQTMHTCTLASDHSCRTPSLAELLELAPRQVVCAEPICTHAPHSMHSPQASSTHQLLPLPTFPREARVAALTTPLG